MIRFLDSKVVCNGGLHISAFEVARLCCSNPWKKLSLFGSGIAILVDISKYSVWKVYWNVSPTHYLYLQTTCYQVRLQQAFYIEHNCEHFFIFRTCMCNRMLMVQPMERYGKTLLFQWRRIRPTNLVARNGKRLSTLLQTLASWSGCERCGWRSIHQQLSQWRILLSTYGRSC